MPNNTIAGLLTYSLSPGPNAYIKEYYLSDLIVVILVVKQRIS